MAKTSFKLRSGNASSFKNLGSSPVKNNGDEDVVSYESPGPGWTKLRGTNIWSPPKKEPKLKKEGKTRESFKKGLVEGAKKTLKKQ
tara:strand:+ start:274 stop:531 length:258 start_codon:yes stop_codon:yes gene_type:complete